MSAYTGVYGAPGVGLASFPTADDAAAYLSGKLDAFLALGPHIVDLEHRAAAASYAAKQAGDTARADQLKALIPKLSELHGEWLRTMDRWDAIRAAVPGLGAWIIPVAWAAAVIVVASAAVIIFAKSDALTLAIQGLENGTLTPEQFRQYMDAANRKAGPGVWDGLNSAMKTGAVVLGIFVAYRVFMSTRGGPARW